MAKILHVVVLGNDSGNRSASNQGFCMPEILRFGASRSTRAQSALRHETVQTGFLNVENNYEGEAERL